MTKAARCRHLSFHSGGNQACAGLDGAPRTPKPDLQDFNIRRLGRS